MIAVEWNTLNSIMMVCCSAMREALEGKSVGKIEAELMDEIAGQRNALKSAAELAHGVS